MTVAAVIETSKEPSRAQQQTACTSPRDVYWTTTCMNSHAIGDWSLCSDWLQCVPVRKACVGQVYLQCTNTFTVPDTSRVLCVTGTTCALVLSSVQSYMCTVLSFSKGMAGSEHSHITEHTEHSELVCGTFQILGQVILDLSSVSRTQFSLHCFTVILK